MRFICFTALLILGRDIEAMRSVSETSAVRRGVAGGQPLEEPSERLAAAFSRAPCVAHSA